MPVSNEKKKKDFHKYILGVETRALSVAARPHAPESQDHSWLHALAFFFELSSIVVEGGHMLHTCS